MSRTAALPALAAPPAARRAALTLALLLLLAALALLAGAALAPPSLRLAAGDPSAAQRLVEFGEVETSSAPPFRWAERGAALQLSGLTRAPLLLDMRMASPRPADADPAEARLRLGRWSSGSFLIRPEWRRYRVLLPGRAGGPDLELAVRTFRPDTPGDRRRLGAALSDLTAVPAGPTGMAAALGPWRAGLLLLLPLLASGAARRIRPAAAFPAAAAALALVALAAARPLAAAALLPDLWLIPAFALVATAGALLLRPSLAPQLAALRARLASDQARLALVLAVALAHGLVYLLLVPPWQHYDEPAHFEFAWLIVNSPGWPAPGTRDPRIDWIGGEGRGAWHPPTYHLLAGLPLRLAGGLDIVAQLYLARGVSLALFLLAVAAVGGLARELTPAGHPLRWLAPLVAALIPPFADIMTAVNNDVGAVAAFTLFLWAAARIIRRGPTPARALGLVAAAAASAAMKNTALIALPLLPLVLLLAVGARRGWPWARLAAGVLAAVVALLPLVVGWGDPAGWYRWGAATAAATIRVESPAAIDGRSVLQLPAGWSPFELSGLTSPLLPADVRRLAGGPVTVGAWVWASRPASVAGPGVMYNDGNGPLVVETPPVEVGTTPRFVAWTFDAPHGLSTLQLVAPLPPPGGEPPLVLSLDGAVVAQGAFPADAAPSLDPGGAGGVWGGRRFDNLLRGPSAEASWPRVRPWFEQAASLPLRRSPARFLAALADVGRTGPMVLGTLPDLAHRSFATFGWGEVALPGGAWRLVIPPALLLLLAGAARAVARMPPDPRRLAIVCVGLIGLLVWLNAGLRILPAMEAQPPPFPRYGFPAVAPLALAVAGGWLAWWPRARRAAGAAALVVGLLTFAALAIAVLWWHHYV